LNDKRIVYNPTNNLYTTNKKNSISIHYSISKCGVSTIITDKIQMKKFSIFLAILVAMTITTKAQTAADYYLPLRVGNYTHLYTTTSGGWAIRTTYYRFIRAEYINSTLYFVEKATEILDDNPTDTLTFRFRWLREDNQGNIVIGAYGTTEDETLDSATVLSTPGKLFPNEYLTKDYTQTFVTGADQSLTDSVISVTATAGSYTNCIQIRTTNKTNDSITLVEDSYYAYHVGIVKVERTIPSDQYHIDNLVNYVANPATGIENSVENNNKFSIYPNPASELFTLNIGSANNEYLSLSIYNMAGSLVKSEILKQNQQQINISDLSCGTYMVEIRSEEGSAKQKLIIQR
jgi:hypothetical protein